MSATRTESPTGNVHVTQEGNAQVPSLTLTVYGESAVNDLRKMLQNSANCRWENMSDDMRWLMDVLVHGQKMPSHRDSMPPQQLTSTIQG